MGFPANASADGTVGEILVTARKREENLQETPLSISAFSADSLDARGITKVDKVAAIAPNVVFQNTPTYSGTTSNAVIYIRGVGQNDFTPAIEPGVGLYVDGVYIGRSIGSVLDLVDVERIEVLRGPQGTLFGRNTIGGAISITSSKPDEDFGGKVDVKLGTDARFNARGSLNVPISDELFSKFTVASFQQDGYVIRPDGKELGDDDTLAARGAMRWVPSDAVEVNFSMDYSRDDESGPPIVLTGVDFFGAPPPAAPSQAVTNNVIASIIAGAAAPPGDPTYCASDPAGQVDPLCYNAQWVQPVGGKRNFGNGDTYSETDIWGASLTIDWDLGAYQVKSISSYRKLDAEFAVDQDGSPVSIGTYTDGSPIFIGQLLDLYEQEQVSQELQVLGSAFDSRLEWLLGAYYFTEDSDNINPVKFTAVRVQSGGHYQADSWALFGQGTYALTDQLKLTAGIRYSDDQKDFLPDQFIEALNPFLPPGALPPPGTPTLPPVTVTTESSEVLPLITLSFQWTPDLLTYASYSEGYKAGGFTQRIFPPEESTPIFDPEFVKSYELGAKWTGWEDRLRLNGAVFFSDYEDLQLSVADETRVGPFTTNAGDAEIKGLELELALVPANDWAINAAVGLTDAEYTRLAGNVRGLTLDTEFGQISKWSASASIEKRIGLGGAGAVVPRIDWTYRSDYITNVTNIPSPQFGLEEPDLHLVNLSGTWTNSDENLAVTLGIDNLTDEEYRTFGDAQLSFGWANQVFDRGRQWFVLARYSF
jgi:iron complex outermembrane receptor protein